MTDLLDQVIDAHGGMRRWGKVKAIKAHVESGGMLMRLKGKARQFRSYGVEADTATQRLVIDPYPQEGQRGVFDEGTVRIETADGESLGERANARDGFFGAQGLARNLRWSDRDALYFAGYALWNYLNAPFLFKRTGFATAEGEAIESEEGERLRCLVVDYPEGFHTHCPQQRFYFDSEGMLRRHDYHPEVVAAFANAAHLSQGYEKVGGITFPTSRRVFPKAPTGTPLAHPVIVALDLSEIELL